MPGFKINNQGSGPNPNVEVSRLYRWSLKFDEIASLKDVVLYAVSVQRPSAQIDVMVMHRTQTQVHLPGKHKWGPINVKFYDILEFNTWRSGATVADDLSRSFGFNSDFRNKVKSGSTSKILYDWWSGNGIGSVVNLEKNTISPRFRTTCQINTEDGMGNSNHKYTLYNVWPTKVDPAELDYSNNNLSTISVTLQFDACDEV